jgi:hypothetical protein
MILSQSKLFKIENLLSYRETETWPIQPSVSQADKKENEKLEYDWDKDLIANVFKSGFNWHAP